MEDASAAPAGVVQPLQSGDVVRFGTESSVRVEVG